MALSMCPSPLTMMMTVSGAKSSTRGVISSPVMPPIVISLKTRSNSRLRRRSSASSAEPASVHSQLSRSRRRSSHLICRSSSTIRMFALPPLVSIVQTSPQINLHRASEHFSHLAREGVGGEGLLYEVDPLVEHAVVDNGVVRVAGHE